jgi:ABC-type nitrate/sulfonate/bicarbonate transport system permease component
VSAVSSVPPLRGIAPFVAVLCVWQLAGSDRSVFFPRPSAWFQSLGHLAHQGVLWPAIWSTFGTLVLAMIVATIIGAGLGYLLGRSHVLDRALSPTLEVLRPSSRSFSCCWDSAAR